MSPSIGDYGAVMRRAHVVRSGHLGRGRAVGIEWNGRTCWLSAGLSRWLALDALGETADGEWGSIVRRGIGMASVALTASVSVGDDDQAGVITSVVMVLEQEENRSGGKVRRFRGTRFPAREGRRGTTGDPVPEPGEINKVCGRATHRCDPPACEMGSTGYLWPRYPSGLGRRMRHARSRSTLAFFKCRRSGLLFQFPRICPLQASSAQNAEGTAAGGRVISPRLGLTHPATVPECETVYKQTSCSVRLYNLAATPNLPSAWEPAGEATLRRA